MMIYVEVLQLTDNFDQNLGGKREFLHIPDFCQICPATDDSPLGVKRQRIEGRKERYIRVVISERGTGISFNAMQYFSKVQKVQKWGIPGTMSPKPMVVKVMKQK